MLAAYKGEVRLQQINWLDLEESSIPVPLIPPREKTPSSTPKKTFTELSTKICPEKKKTSAPHVDKAIVNQTVPVPSSSSNAGLDKNSQKIQETKLNVDSSKPKNNPKVTETIGKTKKISTPSIDKNEIEQASKKRKTEVVNAPTAKLVTMKIAANDSATQISRQPPKPVFDPAAKKMRPSSQDTANKSLNSSSVKPAHKRVRSSLPSVLPTENAGKILPLLDCPSINDPNDQEAHNKEQIKEAVGMDNEKMVQETQVPIGEIPPPPKKSVSSSTLSVAEVCSEFDLKDVQVDLETENLILQQGIEYKPYSNHVWPLVREANPSVSFDH